MNDQPVEESICLQMNWKLTPHNHHQLATTDDSATPSATIDVPLAATIATTAAAAAAAAAARVSEEKLMLEPEESELTSSTKNSDILKQIGEIIAGKANEEGNSGEGEDQCCRAFYL